MKKFLVGLMMLVSVGAMAQAKVGFVNSQALLDTMPSRKAAEAKYVEFEKAGYTELQTMQADLEKAYKDYQVKVADMSPVIREAEERKLMKKEQGLQERQQSLQQELQMYSQELNAPILDRVQEAVKVVAERKKLNYVVDQTTTLYYNAELDITNEVAVELLRLDAAAQK